MKKIIFLPILFLLVACGPSPEEIADQERLELKRRNCLSINKLGTSTVKEDSRNLGLELSVQCENFLNPKILVIDVIKVESDKSTADVFRVFFQIAENLEGKQFDKVYLASKGKNKLYIEGEYFGVLGSSFSYQNPVYLLRTFPENTHTLDGKKAFPTWTGGLIGVTSKQMEDLNSLARDWFIEDLL